jgi:ubiquinone/menaquinone biosynthesis C-methylase UbiE
VPGNPFYKERSSRRGSIDTSACFNGIRHHRLSMSPPTFALGISLPFGCGPGYTTIEIANWIGPGGHVHALDINADFVAQVRKNADAASVGDRVTAHRTDGSTLPLPHALLDRLTARNTLIYVDDPEAKLRECRRVIRPNGKLDAIEGDWPMMVVEPVPAADWSALVTAASRACRTPDIGRKLYTLLRRAGFSAIDVQLITRPDTEGRLLPMIKTIAD